MGDGGVEVLRGNLVAFSEPSFLHFHQFSYFWIAFRTETCPLQQFSSKQEQTRGLHNVDLIDV